MHLLTLLHHARDNGNLESNLPIMSLFKWHHIDRDKQGRFFLDTFFSTGQNHRRGEKKPEATHSARFHFGTAVECCKLNVNLDAEWVQESTDSMGIHISVPGLVGEFTSFLFFPPKIPTLSVNQYPFTHLVTDTMLRKISCLRNQQDTVQRPSHTTNLPIFRPKVWHANHDNDHHSTFDQVMSLLKSPLML